MTPYGEYSMQSHVIGTCLYRIFSTFFLLFLCFKHICNGYLHTCNVQVMTLCFCNSRRFSLFQTHLQWLSLYLQCTSDDMVFLWFILHNKPVTFVGLCSKEFEILFNRWKRYLLPSSRTTV